MCDCWKELTLTLTLSLALIVGPIGGRNTPVEKVAQEKHVWERSLDTHEETALKAANFARASEESVEGIEGMEVPYPSPVGNKPVGNKPDVEPGRSTSPMERNNLKVEITLNLEP